jgi:hypothetical protein
MEVEKRTSVRRRVLFCGLVLFAMFVGYLVGLSQAMQGMPWIIFGFERQYAGDKIILGPEPFFAVDRLEVAKFTRKTYPFVPKGAEGNVLIQGGTRLIFSDGSVRVYPRVVLTFKNGTVVVYPY